VAIVESLQCMFVFWVFSVSNALTHHSVACISRRLHGWLGLRLTVRLDTQHLPFWQRRK